MTGIARVTVRRGTRVAFDGGLWEVAELDGEGVLLRSALGQVRRESIGHLLSQPGTRVLDAPGGVPAPVPDPVQGMLTGEEERELGILAGHMREMLTGYRHGSEALALPGSPGRATPRTCRSWNATGPKPPSSACRQ